MTARAISIEAYHAHIDSGKALTQWQRILLWLRFKPNVLKPPHVGWTRAELANALGIRDSAVCGRVNALLKAGLIVELPRRRCTVTGHQAHPVTVAE